MNEFAALALFPTMMLNIDFRQTKNWHFTQVGFSNHRSKMFAGLKTRQWWHLVASFSYAHDRGELSNSQKQAVITLLEKKARTKALSRTGDQYH